MTRGRAITLVEVVAATALLALTIGALVPLLRDARGIGEPDAIAIELFELSRAADAIFKNLEPSDVADLARVPRHMDWPGDAGQSRIGVRAEIVSVEERVWAWVTFEHSGLSVARWAQLPGAEP